MTAIVLLSLFSWRLARVPGAGAEVACGCFGSGVTTRPVALARCALLLAVAALGAAGTLTGPSGTDPAGVLVCGAAAALIAVFVVRLPDITSVFTVRR